MARNPKWKSRLREALPCEAGLLAAEQWARLYGEGLHMKLRLAVVTLLTLTAFAQQLTPTAVFGTIERISGNQIQVKAGTHSITFHADRDTQIWKGKTYNDLSALKVGDQISVRGIKDASGKLVASNIWAQMVTFSAVIKKVDRANSEVLTSPKADLRSANWAESKVVHYFPNTAFSTSEMGLSVGQEILVVGLDLRNGNVDATRITIYNTDLPANPRMPARPPR